MDTGIRLLLGGITKSLQGLSNNSHTSYAYRLSFHTVEKMWGGLAKNGAARLCGDGSALWHLGFWRRQGKPSVVVVPIMGTRGTVTAAVGAQPINDTASSHLHLPLCYLPLEPRRIVANETLWRLGGMNKQADEACREVFRMPRPNT
jgi:hypothetical protein